MIEVKNLSKKYSNKVTAVNDISTKFEDGKFYGIMGPSGSGKSTLLQIIGTLDNPTSGSVSIDDEQVNISNGSKIADIRIHKIGFVFQQFNLHPHLSALDNVILPMYVNKDINKINYKEKAKELLEIVGMSDRATHLPKQLSGGEQQRVAIARAIANSPSYILADEPTGNLDSTNEKVIFALLKKLSATGKTVIVVSHNEIVKDYADEILYMRDGKFEVQA